MRPLGSPPSGLLTRERIVRGFIYLREVSIIPLVHARDRCEKRRNPDALVLATAATIDFWNFRARRGIILPLDTVRTRLFVFTGDAPMTKPKKIAVNRRGFLKGAATAAAGAAALGTSVQIPDLEAAQNGNAGTSAPPPSAEQV